MLNAFSLIPPRRSLCNHPSWTAMEKPPSPIVMAASISAHSYIYYIQNKRCVAHATKSPLQHCPASYGRRCFCHSQNLRGAPYLFSSHLMPSNAICDSVSCQLTNRSPNRLSSYGGVETPCSGIEIEIVDLCDKYFDHVSLVRIPFGVVGNNHDVRQEPRGEFAFLALLECDFSEFIKQVHANAPLKVRAFPARLKNFSSHRLDFPGHR